MLKSGLVSITFRKKSPREIVDLVRQAGLDGIEWGGDVHVPHGDLACAEEVRRMTADAGLRVASYGSYYRVGATREFTFDEVLDTAGALGTDVVRVWAGDCGSAAADAAVRERVAEESRRIADAAGARGMRIACEFHGGTLTDTTESALALMRAVGRDNFGGYWQPPRGWSQATLVNSLEAMLPHLVHLHVFQWADDGKRLPLAHGAARWLPLLRLVTERRPAERFAMIEFVRDDADDAFLEDAAVLKSFLREAEGLQSEAQA